MAVLCGTAACSSNSDSGAGERRTAVVLTAQAVSPTGVYLSWLFAPGSCGMSSTIYQDGAPATPPIPPSEYSDSLDYPSSYNLEGLAAESRHCFYIVVTEGCPGGWSGTYSSYEFTSNTVCVTTLPAGAPPDTTAPFVVSTTPGDGASGVWTGSIIHVSFSEIVDPATVTHASFTVSDPGGPILGGGLIGIDGTVAQFFPLERLASQKTYTAAVTAQVTDLAGNPLVPLEWTFTTQ